MAAKRHRSSKTVRFAKKTSNRRPSRTVHGGYTTKKRIDISQS